MSAIDPNENAGIDLEKLRAHLRPEPVSPFMYGFYKQFNFRFRNQPDSPIPLINKIRLVWGALIACLVLLGLLFVLTSEMSKWKTLSPKAESSGRP